MVAQRRKLLDYLKGQSEERYAKLIKGLGYADKSFLQTVTVICGRFA